ncbi:hypothetical protein L208DRAFT_1407346 [Tricholoma matsutake]|nr:hypothetical protein L208DRAFT_1407346 [Tricholoma matsutake 945]
MASTTSIPAFLLSRIPVQQPPHLEGDASLATEILPGPPSVVSAQQSVLKRDPRKPSTAYSYLPPSDPGSTYSGIMHGTLIGHEYDASPSKRSKTTTGRAQRASARNQNGAVPILDPSMEGEVGSASILPLVAIDVDSYTMVVDDQPLISRSNSFGNLEGISTNSTGRSRRKEKAKAKETEHSGVKVKEEPKSISLHSPEPPISTVNNDDHCSSCRSHGALVYCDGCPRAFHLWCLDPPMENVDEGDSRWFCPSCMIRKHPPRKPPPSLLSPLIHQVDNTIPTEFQLPEDVRTFFKDVATGPKGTYVDSSEIKQPRLNRHGQLEDRDAFRLKDRNGVPVLCFQCGTSALPGSLAAAVPATKRARRSSTKAVTPEAWKSIISCDYCDLHWHLDCLDPPLPTMPPFTKKWMCPVHAEQVIPAKRRVPKQGVPPIEITKPHQFNNGNIEIIHPETTRPLENVDKVAVDEVLINGRRYRVPERIVVLDFWNKMNKVGVQLDKDFNIGSGMSSPLTSLSSLDDPDERQVSGLSFPSRDPEDLKVAQLLCSLQSSRKSVAAPSSSTINGFIRKTVDSGVQTEPEYVFPARTKDLKQPQSNPVTKRPRMKHGINGSTGPSAYFPSDPVATPTEPTPSTAKRKKIARSVQPEPHTRELRSRSKNNVDSSLTSISSRSSLRRVDDTGRESLPLDGILSAPPPHSTLLGKSRTFQIKVEEMESSLILGSSSIIDTGLASFTPVKSSSRRTRAPRKVTRKLSGDLKPEEREKRGRKRKEREDELPGNEGRDRPEVTERVEKEKKERQKKKVVRTPSRQGHVPLAGDTTPASVPPSISIPVTPSLKIRLPRLGNVNHHHASPLNATGDNPARL